MARRNQYLVVIVFLVTLAALFVSALFVGVFSGWYFLQRQYPEKKVQSYKYGSPIFITKHCYLAMGIPIFPARLFFGISLEVYELAIILRCNFPIGFNLRPIRIPYEDAAEIRFVDFPVSKAVFLLKNSPFKIYIYGAAERHIKRAVEAKRKPTGSVL